MSGHQPSSFGALNYVYHRHYKENSWQKYGMMRCRLEKCKNLYQMDLKSHFGCVNAIEFSHGAGEWITSGGDDKRVMLWNVEKTLSKACQPVAMKGEHNSNIFCLAFDNQNKKIFSGGNDEQVVVHDVERRETLDVFSHDDAVYGLSVDPTNDNVFASACDDGRILLYDIREHPGNDPFCLANYMSPMHAVMFNPAEPRLLATANSKEGIGLWDVRKPRSCVLRYGGSYTQQSCMSVRINQQGNQIIGLRRRLPPVLYNIHKSTPACQFDHIGYYNSCTMKSCCFAGEKDQYIVSGSDDFNLYMWKIPTVEEKCPWVNNAHLVLRGHRSIVNQVRFNPANHLLISSGVEKVIKAWSPFPIDEGDRGEETDSNFKERLVYSHEEYINLVLRSGQIMTHDYSHENTEEDPRMMAFFDSLVQRELEGWSTDEDASSSDSESYERYVPSSHSEHSGAEQDRPQSGSDDERGYSPFTLAFASVLARQAQDENNDERNNSREQDSRPWLQDILDEAGRSLIESLDEPLRPPAEEEDSPNTRKRTITELIAQKRKEYLTNVVKHTFKNEQTAGTSRTSSNQVPARKCKLWVRKVDANDDSSSSTSSGSSTSSSETESNNDESITKTKKKLTSRKKKGKCSTDSGSEKDEMGHPFNKRSAEAQRKQLKNLQRLRAHVLNEESLTSDNDQINGAENVSKPVKCNDKTSCLQNGDLGFKNKHFETSQNGVQTCIASCSKMYAENACNGVTDHCNGESATNNQHETNGDACMSSQSNNDTKESTWTQFKRFKSKMEKARRQYRKHSRDTRGASGSSDDDDAPSAGRKRKK